MIAFIGNHWVVLRTPAGGWRIKARRGKGGFNFPNAHWADDLFVELVGLSREHVDEACDDIIERSGDWEEDAEDGPWS